MIRCSVVVFYSYFLLHDICKGEAPNRRILTPVREDPAFNLKPDPNNTFVIIQAGYRSGSTFLGSIFDANPNFQYLMEPLHSAHVRNLKRKNMILGARSDHTEVDWAVLYLQQMLHNCTLYPSPFPAIHKWCGTREERLDLFNSTECDNQKVPEGYTQQDICNYRKLTAIKVIRLKNLKSLLRIKNIKDANIKFIQLLRHPVATIMSRRTFHAFFFWNFKLIMAGNKGNDLFNVTQRRTKTALEAFHYCKDHLETIEFVKNNPWFKERYMLVTHRELSLDPLDVSQKIYDFIGQPLDDRIREHILNVTGAQSQGYLERGNDALNIFRNTSTVVNKWQSFPGRWAKYWDVYSIEEQCNNLYKYLGQPYSVDGASQRLPKLIELSRGVR